MIITVLNLTGHRVEARDFVAHAASKPFSKSRVFLTATKIIAWRMTEKRFIGSALCAALSLAEPSESALRPDLRPDPDSRRQLQLGRNRINLLALRTYLRVDEHES